MMLMLYDDMYEGEAIGGVVEQKEILNECLLVEIDERVDNVLQDKFLIKFDGLK